MKKKHIVYCMKFRFLGGPLDGGKWYMRCTDLPEIDRIFQWHEKNKFLYKCTGGRMSGSRSMIIDFDYCGVKDLERIENSWIMATS